jgi:5-hydroxyisourate hydrolase
MSGVTTHVLDIASGSTPAGIRIELWVEQDGAFHLIRALVTNAQGRTDTPLLAPAETKPGQYQLVFAIGDYYARDEAASAPPFFNRVPVRFTIHDTAGHYHVPLLVAPAGYQSYRGS